MDTVSYRSSPGKVEVTLGGTASFGDARGDMLSGFNNIIGSAFDDILTGDNTNNVIEGLGGADTLDGGGDADIDTLSYASSNAGVTVDLRAGTGNNSDNIRTSSGGHATGDEVTLGSFENIIGSAHRDTLTGGNAANKLEGRDDNDILKGGEEDDTLDGGPGGDTLDGEDGEDTVTYADATEGVTVDLSSVSERDGVTTISNSSGRGDARGDRFIDIEKFVGSDHDDTFIAGPEVDDINAGTGADTISYKHSTRYAVVVDISDTGAQDGDGSAGVTDRPTSYKPYEMGDILTGFENIIGTNVSSTATKVNGTGGAFHDVLTGNNLDNVIDGGGGDDEINGGAGNDRLIGGSGNDTINGDGGNDTIDGGSGDDTIDGGNDSDTIVFSSSHGKDTINNFASDDVLDLSAYGSGLVTFTVRLDNASDTTNTGIIVRSSSSITLTGIDLTSDSDFGEANLHFGDRVDAYRLTVDYRDNTQDYYKIWGGAGDDNIKGGNGGDTLNGGAGDDTIEGDAGADTMDGGDGNNDTLSYAGSLQRTDRDAANYISGVTVTLNSPPDSSVNAGTDADGDISISNFENLTGSSHNDMLTGDSDPNVIKGESGQDQITGGGGADILEGGNRGDRLTGDSDDFLSYEGSSSVTVDLSERANRDLTENEQSAFGTTTTTVNNAIKVSGSHATGDIATGFNNVIGGDRKDILTGDIQANELRGMGGNDELTGGAGDDTLIGGEGGDTLSGGTGVDTLDGGPGADKLYGGGTDGDEENDIATYASATEGVTVDLSDSNLGSGDAKGDTYTGIELYVGSAHDDVFIAGKDEHNMNGGDGSDTISYERSESEEGVTVALTSSTGTITQFSNDANNPVDSYARGDTLTSIENAIGSNHDDDLTAGSDGSVIDGGKGDDDLTGGRGSDTFVFASGDGEDEVNDFTHGSVGNYDKIDLSAFSSIASMDDLEGEITLLSNETDTDIDLPNNGEITLLDVTPTQLTPDNFIFHDRPVNGTSSSNVLEGDLYNNTMNGMGGDDRMYGEKGRDTMNGGSGDDEMYGGEDKDILNGGEGDDLMDGGPGIDTFVIEPGHGNDHIMDFTSGTDKIDLSAFVDENGIALLSASDVDDITPQNDGIYVIDLTEDGGGIITLLGVDSVDTGNNGDFMF